ncbi:MAG: filamentous hemagglutinin family protein [Parasphingorhabdus sp.]|jgi:filamentous hemagglutinin family protein
MLFLKHIGSGVIEFSVLVFLMLIVASTSTYANPAGPTVMHGQVDFSTPDANTLNITNSPNSIINWQDFSIGRSELTRFIQKNGASAVLNRIIGDNPSNILGQLRSNGRVFLVNPNGVIFGEGSVVDTAGLVSSTLGLSDMDFLKGNYQFEGDASSGDILNQGFITTTGGGETILLAPNVENRGVISSQNGQILLAAGQKITLTSMDIEDVSVEIQAPQHSVVNLGKLLADGGSAALIAGTLVHSGMIQANTLARDKQGQLWLEASDSARIGGQLSASGQTGGDITITAAQLSLEFARIDANGTASGGDIRIGGDYQGGALGKNANNALIVSVDKASEISADATSTGNGGRVIVWSDHNTRVDGKLSARGGISGGNGGLIEISSSGQLNFSRAADVSAPAGKGGTWLLDPEDISIGSGEAASISEALNQGSNVEIKTSDSGDGEGNISVNSSIEKTAGGDASLRIKAHNRININASISSSEGKLSVSLKAGKEINVNAGVSTNGGGFSTTIDSSLLPEPEEEVAEEEGPEGQESEEDISGGDTTQPEDESIADDDQPVEPETDGTVESSIDDPLNIPQPIEDLEITEFTQVTDVVEVVLDLDDPVDIVPSAIEVAEVVATAGGDILVDGGENGTVIVAGTLDSSAAGEGGQGGDITIMAETIELEDEAIVDASGIAGGGEVLIGGGKNGADPNVRNAKVVVVGEAAEIHSDALDFGDGGVVVVYGAESLRVDGKITANGGANGGDGGFIETSSHGELILNQAPDASSPHGKHGEWLIDPTNVELNAIWGTIITSLTGGTTVTVETTSAGAEDGNIFTTGALDFNGIGMNRTLNLFADNNVLINHSITDSNSSGDSLNLDLRADCTWNGATCTANDAGSVIVDATGGAVEVDLNGGEFSASGWNVHVLGGDNDGESARILSGKQTLAAGNEVKLAGGSAPQPVVTLHTGQIVVPESSAIVELIVDAVVDGDGVDVSQTLSGKDVRLIAGVAKVRVSQEASIGNGGSDLTAFDASQNFNATNEIELRGGTANYRALVEVQNSVTITDTVNAVAPVNGVYAASASQNFSATTINVIGGPAGSNGSHMLVAQGVQFPSSGKSVTNADVSQNIVSTGASTFRGGDGDGAYVNVVQWSSLGDGATNTKANQNIAAGGMLTLQGGGAAGSNSYVYFDVGGGFRDNTGGGLDFSQEFTGSSILMSGGAGEGASIDIYQGANSNSSGDGANLRQRVAATGAVDIVGGTGSGSYVWIDNYSYVYGTSVGVSETTNIDISQVFEGSSIRFDGSTGSVDIWLETWAEGDNVDASQNFNATAGDLIFENGYDSTGNGEGYVYVINGAGVIGDNANVSQNLAGNNIRLLGGDGDVFVEQADYIYSGSKVESLTAAPLTYFDISQNLTASGDIDLTAGSFGNVHVWHYAETDDDLVADALMPANMSQNLVATNISLGWRNPYADVVAPPIFENSASVGVYYQPVFQDAPTNLNASQNVIASGDLVVNGGPNSLPGNSGSFGVAEITNEFEIYNTSGLPATNVNARQTVTGGNVTLTGGGGTNTHALITHNPTFNRLVINSDGSQRVTATSGALTLEGGAGDGSHASIINESFVYNSNCTDYIYPCGAEKNDFSQSVSGNTVDLSAGNGNNANAIIKQAAEVVGAYDPGRPEHTNISQHVTAIGLLSLSGGDGGPFAEAKIHNQADGPFNNNVTTTQSINAGSLTLHAGLNADSNDQNNDASIVDEGMGNIGGQSVTVGGDVTLLAGQNPLASSNAVLIQSVNAESTVNAGGAVTIQGGMGNYDTALMQAGTTMTLNSAGDINLIGGNGTDAFAGIEGAVSGCVECTVYIEAGANGSPADINITGNTVNVAIVDDNGSGEVNLSYGVCNTPTGDCAIGNGVFANIYNSTVFAPAPPPGSSASTQLPITTTSSNSAGLTSPLPSPLPSPPPGPLFIPPAPGSTQIVHFTNPLLVALFTDPESGEEPIFIFVAETESFENEPGRTKETLMCQ